MYYLKLSQIVKILVYTHAQQTHTYTLYISTYKVTCRVCVTDRESAFFLLYRLRNISRKGKKKNSWTKSLGSEKFSPYVKENKKKMMNLFHFL